MGIRNIEVIINPVGPDLSQDLVAQMEQRLIADHNRGLHPWGEMRRDCPLCQLNK